MKLTSNRNKQINKLATNTKIMYHSEIKQIVVRAR